MTKRKYKRVGSLGDVMSLFRAKITISRLSKEQAIEYYDGCKMMFKPSHRSELKEHLDKKLN